MHARAVGACRPLEVPPDMPPEQVTRLMLARNAHRALLLQEGAMKDIVSALESVRPLAGPARRIARLTTDNAAPV